MSTADPSRVVPGVTLRIWPGVVAVALLWLFRYGLPAIFPDYMLIGMGVAAASIVGLLIWWLAFSRAPHLERWAVLAWIPIAILLVKPLVHPSVANGMRGRLFFIYAVPLVCLGLVAAAALARNAPAFTRRLTLAAGILLSCGTLALLRTEGITGDGQSQFAWRWSATAEQQVLAQLPSPPAAAAPPAASPSAPSSSAPPPEIKKPVEAAKQPAEAPVTRTPHVEREAEASWPGFRGARRDSVADAPRIATDWSSNPPVLIWKRPIGPAWSSFAIAGDLFYTQEQRGESEVVSCYRLSTGEPVWVDRTSARFWESNAGAGPRGTPTLSGNRVYTFGATGVVRALDAATGSLVWTRNASTDTGAAVPEWGFSSSPLAIDDIVVVAASGRLIAYDSASGEPRWKTENLGGTYSSPHPATLAGVRQIVMLTRSGATSLMPESGAVLWSHSWPGSTMLQPVVASPAGVLITTSTSTGGIGTRRLTVSQRAGGWNVEEMWTSNGLKPYFNDIVVNAGHAYGFDGAILSCIDLADGKRKWKGGRYGHGQLVLLAGQNLLLVITEEGELALVSATPAGFNELARIPAIEGKTWNHPAIAGDTLLVRNGQEMAAFRLPRAQQTTRR